MKRVYLPLLLVLASGCSTLSGDLRQDLNDNPYPNQPTTGGRWVEGGYLSEDTGDSPSVYGERNSSSSRSWTEPSTQSYAPPSDIGAGNPQAYSRQSDLAPPVKRQYKSGSRATRADFVDDQNEGSLWASDGQTNYYFTKNKVRGIGDLITITSEAQLIKDIGYEIARTLTPAEREVELELAQARIKAKAYGEPDPDAPAGSDGVSTSAAAPARTAQPADAKKDPNVIPTVRDATLQDIDVTRSMEMKAGDPIMAEIVERYPNGNYKLRGTKRVNYKQGVRFVTVTSIVKAADIDDSETIASGKLYEYRLEAFR